MTIQALYDALCTRFPESARASFDFDGLQLCPEPQKDVETIVCALDVTRESVEAAIGNHATVLITHHPIFFAGVRTLDPSSSMDAELATELLKNGVAHISLHTRFDAGEGGINDTLAKKLVLENVLPFGTEEEPTLGRQGELKEAMNSEAFAQFVADTLSTHVLFTSGNETVKRVAVVGGAAGDFLDAFVKTDLDALVTGEVAHHRRLLISHEQKTLVEASHYGSEIVFCEAIAKVLSDLNAAADVISFTGTPHERSIPVSKT